MQSVLTRSSWFNQLFRLRSANSAVSSTLVTTKSPLFFRNPPWWARWTWGLIACDIFMTGSAVELTYNRWSTPASNLEDSANGKGSPPPNEYVLRPAWQRTGLCAAHMIFGIGIAVALLVTQTRFIRTLTIIPPSGSDGRRVFVQCAHNLRKNGLVFPYNKCSIRDGRNKTEMILRVAGERGHWHLGLEDAVIHGREIPLPEARAEVLADWGGKRAATLLSPKPKQALDRRWKSGPIRRAGGN